MLSMSMPLFVVGALYCIRTAFVTHNSPRQSLVRTKTKREVREVSATQQSEQFCFVSMRVGNCDASRAPHADGNRKLSLSAFSAALRFLLYFAHFKFRSYLTSVWVYLEMGDYHSDLHFYLKMFHEYLSELSEVRYHHILRLSLNFPGSEPNLKLCQQSLALFLFIIYVQG